MATKLKSLHFTMKDEKIHIWTLHLVKKWNKVRWFKFFGPCLSYWRRKYCIWYILYVSKLKVCFHHENWKSHCYGVWIILQHQCRGRQESQYSDCLWAGQPWGQCLSPSGGKIFLLSTSSRLGLGPTHTPIQWIWGAFSLGVKQTGHETDHSPPTSAKVKNMWMYASTPSYVFMA
jgi:hypothetical protein